MCRKAGALCDTFQVSKALMKVKLKWLAVPAGGGLRMSASTTRGSVLNKSARCLSVGVITSTGWEHYLSLLLQEISLERMMGISLASFCQGKRADLNGLQGVMVTAKAVAEASSQMQ